VVAGVAVVLAAVADMAVIVDVMMADAVAVVMVARVVEGLLLWKLLLI
jgi:hypothetical protein